ncbi:MAG: DUF975 family protein [Oscillospiraceae bacterium]|nr:DUF975 family protein [Oscillospiraceae bacterium]
MDITNRRAVRNRAAEALAANPGDPKKLALIYGGSIALLGLLSSVISYAVGLRIDDTGGLANLGLRSILSTVQSVLPMAVSIIVLFLGFGYQSGALKMARRQDCPPATLLDGFRRFGPVLRLVLMQGVIYLGLLLAATYLGAQIFIMTPLANDYMDIMLPLLSSTSMLDSGVTLDAAMLESLSRALVPMLFIVLALFLAAATPILYQYRLSTYALFDDPGRGAIAAMRESRAMMRHNRFQLFKLDLGFWWYYLAEAAVMVVAYGDVLLPMVGITLPWSETVSYFLFYVLSLVLQTGLYYLFLNRVNVTYATVYEFLRPEPQEPTKVALGNIFEM